MTEMLFGSLFYRNFIRKAQKLTRTLHLLCFFLPAEVLLRSAGLFLLRLKDRDFF